MKKLFLASAALLALSGAASAADMAAAPAYTKAPPPMDPGYNWTGFYIGAMGGYGWSDHTRITVGGVTFTGTGSDINGGFGGGTIGYNWQMGQAVFGLEADGAAADITDSSTALGVTLRERIDAFGSVTGRIGYTWGPTLLYAKGGYAWADNEISAAAVGVGTFFSESHIHSGWTIGGGLEYMFAPNWSAKAEYMYADYGNETYLGGFVPGGVGFGGAFHTVKAGVNYHFGGPVMARY
jgi:outer membrane immunogenic protein